MSYTKLDHGITESTIWYESDPVRLVWITMLSMVDRHGYVGASIPGLAGKARVSLEDCITALDKFMSPDEYSRTKEHEGRRIAEADGGWVLLNHAKYLAKQSEDDRRERARIAMAALRANRKQQELTVNGSCDELPALAHEDVALAVDEDKAEKKKPSQKPKHAQQAARFDEFWSLYPVKKGRKDALQKWAAKKLDAQADAIIADVQNRIANDGDWLRGFVPHGSTYVNGEGWNDGLAPIKPNGNANGNQTPAKLSAVDQVAKAIYDRRQRDDDSSRVIDG